LTTSDGDNAKVEEAVNREEEVLEVECQNGSDDVNTEEAEKIAESTKVEDCMNG
jgi:hypothetical protein